MESDSKRHSHRCFLMLVWLLAGLPGCSGCALTTTRPSNARQDAETAEPVSVGDDAVQETTTVASDQSSPEHPPIKRHSPSSADDAGLEHTEENETLSAESSPPNGNSSRKETFESKPVRGKKKPSDVNSTLEQIHTLRQSAKRAKDEGDLGKAFQDATKAWNAARLHPDDTRCRNLVEQLALEMKELAPNANDRYRMRSTHSRLIVK